MFKLSLICGLGLLAVVLSLTGCYVAAGVCLLNSMTVRVWMAETEETEEAV